MAHSVSRWGLVIVGVAVVTGILGTCSTSRGAEQPATVETLDKKISADFAARPLSDVVKELGKRANTSVQIDEKALRDVGIPLDYPVTFKLSNVSFRFLLRYMLRDLDLTFVLRDEVVLITTPDEANKTLISRVYNVRDLLGTVNKLTDEYEYDPLIEVITQTVKPTSWDRVGGAGSIRGFQDALVVSQTSEVQDEVTALLTALRKARSLSVSNKQGCEPVVAGDHPGNDAIQKTLEQRVNFDGAEHTLAQWAALLSDKYSIPIVFDRRALADLGLRPDSRAKSEVSDLSLRSALRLLLRSADMTFIIENEVLFITTPDEANKTLHNRIYKVSDLIVAHDEHGQEIINYDPLIQTITSTVKPTSWDTVGGVGSIASFDTGKSIVVSQTQEIQEEVADLLRQLRSARLDQETQNSIDRNRSNNNERPIARYELKLPQSAEGETAKVEQIIHVVKDLVDPASWDKMTYIKAVGTTLVVRQTPEVHRQVAKLLKELKFLAVAEPKKEPKEHVRGQRGGMF